MAYNYILTDKYGGRIDSNTDVIYGKESWEANGGNDVLKGLGGGDTIYANGGNDIVDGGTGDDLLNSGFGNDVFYFGQKSGYDTIKGFGHTTGNTDKIVAEGIYNGYYKSPFTGEIVLKFDHDKDGSTDARVLLSGVGESEWLSLGNVQGTVIVTDPNAPLFQSTKMQLAAWDQANANFFGV